MCLLGFGGSASLHPRLCSSASPGLFRPPPPSPAPLSLQTLAPLSPPSPPSRQVPKSPSPPSPPTGGAGVPPACTWFVLIRPLFALRHFVVSYFVPPPRPRPSFAGRPPCRPLACHLSRAFPAAPRCRLSPVSRLRPGASPFFAWCLQWQMENKGLVVFACPLRRRPKPPSGRGDRRRRRQGGVRRKSRFMPAKNPKPGTGGRSHRFRRSSLRDWSKLGQAWTGLRELCPCLHLSLVISAVPSSPRGLCVGFRLWAVLCALCVASFALFALKGCWAVLCYRANNGDAPTRHKSPIRKQRRSLICLRHIAFTF